MTKCGILLPLLRRLHTTREKTKKGSEEDLQASSEMEGREDREKGRVPGPGRGEARLGAILFDDTVSARFGEC